VFCVDEKTAIQALDRLDPVLPLSPGRAERHGFEYYRHGTLSLYAALEVKTGKVEGKTAKRHTSAEFIAFLNQLLSKTRWAKEIHIVLDNLSAHKTKAVEEFLAQHPKVRFHFTPTYSSWLNQVELWFAKIQRDVISRGIFTSVADLARKLRKYIEAYAKLAKPFRWTYTDPQKRIRINEITGTAYQLPFQPNVELNSDFIFGSDARFSGGRDPEVGLLHGGVAGVLATLQRHVDRNRTRLPAQRQCAAQRPPPLVGSLRACGLEHDLLIVLAVEHFRSQHRFLHFSAIFFGVVLVDYAQ
jgi:transposase